MSEARKTSLHDRHVAAKGRTVPFAGWEMPILQYPGIVDEHQAVRSAARRCEGRMKLLAMVTDDKSVTRYLRALGEPTDAPTRTPARGPPYWKSSSAEPDESWAWCYVDERVLSA
ncbi:MAG: hypothetical protein JWP87_1605 [Labilithrix sp.]|nr:hypothetical protein [Labilithrix sp.]